MTELTEQLIADCRASTHQPCATRWKWSSPNAAATAIPPSRSSARARSYRRMVGVARTARFAPRTRRTCAASSRRHERRLLRVHRRRPETSVVVIPGSGRRAARLRIYWGEVNSNVHKGLGCRGVITDGSVRDLPDIAEGFQMMADRVGPSHAFVHVGRIRRNRSRWPACAYQRRVDPRRSARCGRLSRGMSLTRCLDAAKQIAAREAVIISASQQPGFNMERCAAPGAMPPSSSTDQR